jgi:acyl-CoA reductase-like NAD-dependent aldehyde dehydrogenase
MSAATANAVIDAGQRQQPIRDLLTTAHRAGRAWRAQTVGARLAVIARFRDRVAAEAQSFASMTDRRPRLDTLTGEVMPLLEACRYLERHAARLLRPEQRGGSAGAWLPGMRITVEREAYGSVLIVGPSNYGLMLPGIQTIQALVAGNAVVLKPAPDCRASLDRLRELLEYSGLPAGLVQIADEATDNVYRLIDGGIDKLVFTGSGAAGREVLAYAATKLIPITLELSGWDACSVLASADVDRAARAIAFGLRFNNGETCLAPRRILVASEVRDVLVARLVEALEGTQPQAFGDAMRNPAVELTRDAIGRGAQLACGELHAAGLVGPVLLTGVTPEMPIFETEAFGPIALVTEVSDAMQAVRQANATSFALGATIFALPTEARALASGLDAGVVMINDVIVPAAHPAMPIAARKASGFGVTRGPEGLLELTRPKVTVTSRSRRPRHLDAAPAAIEGFVAHYIDAAYRRGWRVRILAVLRAARALYGHRAGERRND